MSRNFTTVALPFLRRAVRSEVHVQAEIFIFGILDFKLLTLYLVFSWSFPSLCQYPYTNTTHSHYKHRPHYTISYLCSSLSKSSVCVCLKNINTEPSQQISVLCTHISRLLSISNICTSLRGHRSNRYTIRTFRTVARITLRLCVEVSLKIGRTKWKIWIIKIMRERGGNGRACGQCEKCGGSRNIAPVIRNQILYWDERTAIHPGRLTLEGTITGAVILMVYDRFSN